MAETEAGAAAMNRQNMVDLRWVFPIRRSPMRARRWLLGGGLLAVNLSFFWACGIFAAQGNVGAALFFSMVIAYIVPVFGYISERTVIALDNVAGELDAGSDQVQRWRRSVYRKPAGWLVTVLSVGIIAGTLHNLQLSLFDGLQQHGFMSVPDVAIAIGTSVTWMVMTLVVAALIANAAMLAEAGRRCRVNLLDTRRLRPFATVAVISTLAIIGAQALFPLMSVGGGATWVAFIPGLVATGVPMLLLAAMPVWPVHRRIATARERALDHVDRHIAALPAPDPDAPESLLPLAPLLAYRRELRELSEWPFDVGVLTRLGLYLIIPPLTWVGAALIENLVEAFL